MKRTNKKTKAEAITQILILVISIVAISWMIGGEFRDVSAVDNGDITSAPCLLTFCEGANVYGSKRNLAGTCVIDIINLKERCDYGCSAGICKAKFQDNKITVQEILSTANTGLGIKNVADEVKRSITPAPANSEKIAELVGSAGGAAGDIAYDTAFATAIKAKNAAGIYGEEATKYAATQGALARNAAVQDTIDGGVKKIPKDNNFDFHLGQLLAHAGVAIAVGGLTKYVTTEMGYTEKAIKTGMYLVGTTYLVTTYIASSLHATVFGLGSAAAEAAAAGTTATFAANLGSFAATGLIGLGAAAAMFLVYFGLIAKKQAVQTVIYNCYNWDAEPKGLKCDLCNRQSFPCTEYQCKSLGQACELIKDANDENYGLCFWKNKNDNKYPLIQVWEEAPFFDKTNYKYIENTVIAPPDKGVYISYAGPDRVSRGDGNIKCIPPFEPVAFGIKLDEIAMCKISPESSNSYSEMPEIYFNNGDSKYNHSLLLSHKSSELMGVELRNNYENERTSLINEGASSEELQILDQAYQEQFELINNREYTYYVRCKDANDNPNTNQFIFKFCVSDFDGSPPVILYANPSTNSPIGYGLEQQDVKVYLNEPSECKWDRVDRSYSEMLYSMTCNNQQAVDNGQMVYTCDAVLDGLKDKTQNKFYFRCKDKPLSVFPDVKESERYAMDYSYKYVLIGTQPLVIENISPNATTIEDSTTPIMVDIQVKTMAGYNEGRADCYISQTGQTGTYGIFADTGSYEHSQKLWLGERNYNYFIKCIDLGGNTDTAWINFSVNIDNDPPIVVRVYKEDDYLKLITDEPGKCVYSTFGCTYLFDDGTRMTSLKDKEYYAEWNIKNSLYIKCEDGYGNQPLPNVCSIIARPFEIFAVQ